MNMEQESSFEELLRRFRKSYDYTQAEVAKRFGYAEETVRSWEQSRRFPARDEVERLAHLMELSPDEVKCAIRVGRARAKSDKIEPKGVPSVIAQVGFPTFFGQYSLNDDLLTLLEDESYTRWEMYRTGGSLRAYRGLSSWLDNILTVSQEIQGNVRQARALTALCVTYQLEGSICSDLMSYNQSHAAYKKAFRIAQEQHDDELMAATLARRGVTYIQQEQPGKAIMYLNHAATLTANLSTPQLKSYLFKALSEAYAITHQSDESSQSIDLAEYALNEAGAKPEQSYCQVNLISVMAQKGVNEVALGRYHDAIISIEQSLIRYHPAYIRGRARLIAQKAEALYGLKEIAACIDLAEEAYALAEAVGSQKTLARLRTLYAWLVQSRWRKEAGVVRLGALLAIE